MRTSASVTNWSSVNLSRCSCHESWCVRRNSDSVFFTDFCRTSRQTTFSLFQSERISLLLESDRDRRNAHIRTLTLRASNCQSHRDWRERERSALKLLNNIGAGYDLRWPLSFSKPPWRWMSFSLELTFFPSIFVKYLVLLFNRKYS